MFILVRNALLALALLAPPSTLAAEPRANAAKQGAEKQLRIAAEDTSQRSGRRQTRGALTVTPNIPEEGLGDEVANRQGKAAEAANAPEGKAMSTTPAPQPATRGMRR